VNRRQLLTRALGAVDSLSLYGPAAVALKPRRSAPFAGRRSDIVLIDEADPCASASLERLLGLLEEYSSQDWLEAEFRLFQSYHQWAAGQPESQL